MPTYNEMVGSRLRSIRRQRGLSLQDVQKLSDQEFNQLCDRLSPLLNEEYQICQGNKALLESCIEMSDKDDVVPAQVILDRMMRLIQNGPGLLIIV